MHETLKVLFSDKNHQNEKKTFFIFLRLFFGYLHKIELNEQQNPKL